MSTAAPSPVRTAWVEGGFAPNAGQFPIRVERHLNSFVAGHLPGVTTVTRGARYYALHGLVAQIGQDESLDEAEVLDVLRRSEALLAYVTDRHTTSKDHDPATPSPHGIDAIHRSALSADGMDLVTAAATYSTARWGFSNAYRGSELTLKILSPEGFLPGDWYEPGRAASALTNLVETARTTDRVSPEQAAHLGPACLCQMAGEEDATWLAHLLSGDPDADLTKPTMGGLLWQFGRTVAIATQSAQVRDAHSFADLLMFDPGLRERTDAAGLVAARRWRGALLRKESVHALRRLWKYLNDLVGGARPVQELVEAFADRLPAQKLSDFRAGLPQALDGAGRPRAAERELDDLDDLERWLAVLLIGSSRLGSFSQEEAHGFSRGERVEGQWEELSPGWIHQMADRYQAQSLPDLGRMLATTLIHRSQRVALWKSGYRKGRFIYPARLHVRDGIAVQVYAETAPEPATRIPQYLSIATQAGIFEQGSTGQLTIGPNGDRLG